MQLAYKFRISACTGMSYAVLNLLDWAFTRDLFDLICLSEAQYSNRNLRAFTFMSGSTSLTHFLPLAYYHSDSWQSVVTVF
jgi:hypothetical protein